MDNSLIPGLEIHHEHKKWREHTDKTRLEGGSLINACSKRCLVVESIAVKPHLETAGELALCLRDAGHEVAFCYVGNDLPRSGWELPRVAKMMGGSLARRVRRFEAILKREGIRVLPPPSLDDVCLAAAREWAERFRGDLETLKSYRFGEAMLGMGVASSLISWTGNSLFDPGSQTILTYDCLEAAALTFERTRTVLATFLPTELFTFNGRFATCKAIVETARQLEIPVRLHERGATFGQYEIYDDSPHDLGYVNSRIKAAWEAAAPSVREKIGHSFFRRRRGGDGVGWYSFTVRQKQDLIPSRVGGKRRVVYFSSSDDEYAATTDGLTRGPWPDQLSATRALVNASAAQPDIELMLRIHPNLVNKSAAERSRWHAWNGPNLTLIPANSPVDSYALCDSADIVVVFGSTMGVEAAYWGRPVILLGPSVYAGMGIASEPNNSDELAALLVPVVPARAADMSACLAFGHYCMTFGTDYRYYAPESLMEGRFLGDRLAWDPFPVRMLRRLGAGRLYNRMRQRWR